MATEEEIRKAWRELGDIYVETMEELGRYNTEEIEISSKDQQNREGFDFKEIKEAVKDNSFERKDFGSRKNTVEIKQEKDNKYLEKEDM